MVIGNIFSRLLNKEIYSLTSERCLIIKLTSELANVARVKEDYNHCKSFHNENESMPFLFWSHTPVTQRLSVLN